MYYIAQPGLVLLMDNGVSFIVPASSFSSLVAFAAIFVCVGFGMLFLRRATRNEVGPGNWAVAFFLNGAGFLFWAASTDTYPLINFIVGEVLHMLGFVSLLSGVFRFTGSRIDNLKKLLLSGIGIGWLATIVVVGHYPLEAYLLLMIEHSAIFILAGCTILEDPAIREQAGRDLTGWGLISWGVYTLVFPFVPREAWLVSLAIGLLVGLHMAVVLGMAALLLDRMRVRAESSEKFAGRLEGLLPICSYCKKIRDHRDGWSDVETYISERSDADFSHGICPDCVRQHYPELDIAGR